MKLQQIKHWFRHNLVTVCQCCGLSHHGGERFCDDCCAAILSSNSCMACGRALALKSKIALLCGACHKMPPNYDRLIAAGAYQFPLNQLVSRLKYQQKTALAPPLATLLATKISQQYQLENRALPSLMLPVPLHYKRELSRGYNQSTLIALALEGLLDIPTDQQCLFRTINTPAQADSSRAQRLSNLAHAFKCQAVNDLHLAVIDDVVTTGATVTQITKVLKKAGARQVDVWCICRTEY